jgi:hypothetical protein
MFELNFRYKAWIDLYLANGKTVSSNAIEFTTKEKPPKINKIDTSGQFICLAFDKSSKYLRLF